MEHKTPPRSFNTVKNSHREQRAKRKRKERMVLLAIFAVAFLIALTSLVLLVCSVAHSIFSEAPNENDPPVAPPTSAEIVYTSATVANTDLHKGELILVSEDRNLQYVFPAVENLVLIEDIRKDQNGTRPYNTRELRLDEKLASDAAYAVNQMLTDFYLKFGDSSLILMDTHRSQKDQETFSKTPVGFSEHHTGFVFTIRTYNNVNKPAALSQNAMSNWIYENCHKYGIVCRYPADKETKTGISGYDYCFRYVGVPHATYMYKNNLCLEEYLDLLKNAYSNGNVLDITDADKSYKVYYVPASAEELTTITVPQNYKYTVSGDNSGGFIVTIYCNQPIE